MRILILVTVIVSFGVYGQKDIASLPGELAESSALILIGDYFYTLNDSGNQPTIYLFDKNGQIQHTCQIENAENYDWEAMAYDGTHLYIGDIGNNDNDRKNLRIYIVNKDSVTLNASAQARKVEFFYEGQNAFPPEKKQRYFDAEAMVWKNDSLFIFTKNRTNPFDGISRVYYIPLFAEKKGAAKYLYNLELNPTNWMEESITDAYLCREYLFILTYAKIYCYQWKGSSFQREKKYEFDNYTQKEGLTGDRRFFYMTDEDESIISGGNKLYKLRR